MVKVETIIIERFLTDVSERLKIIKQGEKILVLISEECFDEMKKFSYQVCESYTFNGRKFSSAVYKLNFVENFALWVTKIGVEEMDIGCSPVWYTVIGIHVRGETIKTFERGKTNEIIIFDLR